jgi:hypothetical protein
MERSKDFLSLKAVLMGDYTLIVSKHSAKEAANRKPARLKGKNPFHPNLINWSYRYLGNVARAHTNKKRKKVIFRLSQKLPGKGRKDKKGSGKYPPKKTIEHTVLIKSMLAYSAIKNKANPIEEYSTL